MSAAKWCAELAISKLKERIYIVEPLGDFENDPSLTDKRFPGNQTHSYSFFCLLNFFYTRKNIKNRWDLMKKLLIPDKITKGVLTSLIEDTWLIENEENRKNLTYHELIKIHNALIDYDRTFRFEYGDMDSFFDLIPKENHHPISSNSTTSLQDDLCINNFYENGIIIYDSFERSGTLSNNRLFSGYGKRIIWYKNGDIKVYSTILNIDSDGLNFSSIEIDDTNLLRLDDFNIQGHIDDGGRKVHFSQGLGNIYAFVYLLANIPQNYKKRDSIDYFIRPQEINILSCFSVNVRIHLWDSIVNLIEDTINSEKDERKLSLIEFLFEFMFILSIDPSLSHLYKIMEIVYKNNSNQDASVKEIMSMLLKINGNVEVLSKNVSVIKDDVSDTKDDINEIKLDVKVIDSKLDILINRFNTIVLEIMSLLEKNQEEMSVLISDKSSELVNIIDQLHRNDMEQEYLLKQSELKDLYPCLNIQGGALIALTSGFILAGQNNVSNVDQSGAILLLAKGLELLLNDIFKSFMINKLSVDGGFDLNINSIISSLSHMDKELAEWLRDRNSATLGQVAYFCNRFRDERYALGREVNNCLGITMALPRSEEAIIREIINYIKIHLSNQDVHDLRNGFIHKDIAEIRDLSSVVSKTNSLLIGLNNTIEFNV